MNSIEASAYAQVRVASFASGETIFSWSSHYQSVIIPIVSEEVHPPAKLDYAATPNTTGLPAWRLLFCALVFAASYLAAEYSAQRIYFSLKDPPGSPAYFKRAEQIISNILVDCVFIGIGAAVMLLAQVVFHRRFKPRIRQTDWVVAICLGLAYCAFRWVSWWMIGGFRSRLVEVALFSFISGWIVTRWRQLA